jgi:hypothetical protein
MEEILTPEQWYELQGRLRLQYPELTDADLQYHEAIEKDMISMVEYSLQKAKALMQGVFDGHHQLTRLRHYWRYGRESRIRQRV